MSIFQKFSKNNTTRFTVILFLSMAVLIIIAISSILIGSVKIPLSDFLSLITSKEVSPSTHSIIINVRLPRTLAAMLAGAALSVSGSILQNVMNNSLASPSIIGVNSGAALFALIIFSIFPYYYPLIPIAAFIGAFFTAMTVFLVALKTGASRIAIILSGVAISNILSAAIDLISLLNPDQMLSATSFMLGGFSGITLSKLIFPSFYIIGGLFLSLLFAPSLNILNLGDDIASSVGMNVKRYRFIFIAIAALLAGSAVSFSGLLGFVGLLVPHITRLIIGTDSRQITPLSAIFGSIFVIACDILVRIMFAPYEIPVGIMMSFFGGPFFLWLLINQKRGRLNA